MTLTVDAAARTHIGLVRKRNEDSLYVGHHLIAVADGMGGHVSGDIASSTVIDALRAYDRLVKPAELSDTLGHAIYAANKALRDKTTTSPELKGMGSTLVALLWSDTSAVIANVGDSRAYLLRDPGPKSNSSRLVQITEDHTYGNLVADAASVPNLAERITRFLDGRPDGRSPDLTLRQLHAGDRYLLCSDGLSSYVPHQLIHDSMSACQSSDETADHLTTLALDHGGPDNITAIVIDVISDIDDL